MPPGSQTLKEIEKLSAKSADRIKLAVTLAALDAEPASAPSFEDLLAATRMSRRTLLYLRTLGRRMNELGFAQRHYISLGWTKCVLIVQRCTKEKIQAAMDYGLCNTVNQLRQYLDGENDAKTRSILLRLNDRQYKIFHKVLLEYGATAATKGLRGKEAALAKALARVPRKP